MAVRVRVVAQRLRSKIERVWVPVLEGETSVRDSSVMPSYIFIRMKMDPTLHFLISDMQYVINFVGNDRGGRSMTGQMVGNRGFVRPMPIPDSKYADIVRLTKQNNLPGNQAEGDEAGDEAELGPRGPVYELDEMVEVTEGPFKGMSGPVVSLGNEDEDAEAAAAAGTTITVALSVMGRDTPVELSRTHVTKL